jgi:hypothetical protein
VVAREWFDKFKDSWVDHHGKKIFARLENDIFPIIGAKAVGAVTAPELLEALRRIEARGAIDTAHRTLQNCGQIFRYAIATADAVMNGGEADDFIDAYKKWGRLYPNAGYGGRFGGWLNSDDREPNNSWGNGSAMRVSPCGWMLNCGFYARTGCWPSSGWEGVRRSASVTHNHPEGTDSGHPELENFV